MTALEKRGHVLEKVGKENQETKDQKRTNNSEKRSKHLRVEWEIRRRTSHPRVDNKSIVGHRSRMQPYR